MSQMRALLSLLLPALCWFGLTTYFLIQGKTLMATLAALPLIALLLFVLFPNKGLGSFAFTHELGPVQEEEESERKFYLRQAKWWFLASLIFPGSLALAYFFEKNIPFVILCVFAGFLIGVPCFLKGLGSLYDAFKTKN